MSDMKRSNEGPVRDPWFFQRWAHHKRVGNPARRLVLMGLAGIAEGNSGYGWVIPEWLADFAECSEATVRHHLHTLEQAGIIARRREYREGRRTTDAFLLLADEWAAWPGDEPLVREPVGHAGNGRVLSGAVDRLSARVTVPNWDALGECERRTLTELRRFADAKGASLDEMKALAACRDFPDRDHVGAAEKFAAWHVDGKGARRARSDANAAWRKWLQGEDPMPVTAAVAEAGDLARFDFGAEEA